MSDYNKTGGSAFPLACDAETCSHIDCKGMTLRDYFAAKAMQTYCADSSCTDASIAKAAYAIADAMLAARNVQ